MVYIMIWFGALSIPQRITSPGAALFCLAVLFSTTCAVADQQQQFVEAWQAARKGDHATFDQAGPALESYLLYPYWQYEDYRFRRAHVAPAEMAAFLDAHTDWAFNDGLRKAWLKTLGEQGRWQALVDHGGGQRDTELRCYRARARLALGLTDDLLADVRDLWTVGKSQPDACDPLFKWLVEQVSRQLLGRHLQQHASRLLRGVKERA